MSGLIPYLFPVMITITLGNTIGLITHKVKVRHARHKAQEQIEAYDQRLSHLEHETEERVG